MAKSQGDVLKAKQKRQKVIAATLGVVLLGLVGFQAPRVMAKLHEKAPVSSAPTPTSAAGATASPASPTTDGTEQVSSGSTAGDSSAALASAAAPLAGRLASFSRFSSKDPFRQQIADTATDDDEENPGASSSGSASANDSGSTSGASSTSEAGGSGSTGGSDSSTASASDSAVISVNGTLMSVATGTDFPQPSSSDPNAVPVFHLSSQTATTAKISIVGGSYTSGAISVTLRVNKPVTLMNTADGTRYRLVLKPRGTAVPASG